jgi:hypothetical protein
LPRHPPHHGRLPLPGPCRVARMSGVRLLEQQGA